MRDINKQTEMRAELDGYEIVSKIFLGTNLRLILEDRRDTTVRKVLELQEVVGFFDIAKPGEQISTLRLDQDGGGSYNLDLSMRLQRPEIAAFPEVFIFIDKDCVHFCFRAVARVIALRDWVENDKWLR